MLSLADFPLPSADAWNAAGFTLPSFDRAAMIRATGEKPQWIHFGAGNIFRGFPAVLQQTLLETGHAATGIIVAEGFDYEIIEKIYRPFNSLGVLAVLRADGAVDKKTVASVSRAVIADRQYAPADWAYLESVFAAPSLQMVSFTITEKGYTLPPADSAPESAASLMEKITALCLCRFHAGKYPLALVSMDNCSQNGSKLKAAVTAVAAAWVKKGSAPGEFADWLDDPSCVSFPWTMIDKITPRPAPAVQAELRRCGFGDTDIVVTGKNTWIAPFVNAEETGYLVVEDSFPNGRPALEHAGVIFTDRESVGRVEKMKVCTCLNPLHTALAIFGCLLGYTSIHEEMKDADLVQFIRRLGEVEGMPVVADPGIVSPHDFLREVLLVRLPNPFIPDTPQRIACDTSQKLPVRFGVTVASYQARGFDTATLVCVPMVFAAWLRYLIGVTDSGTAFEPSPDPQLERVRALVDGVVVHGAPLPPDEYKVLLAPLLSDPSLFGVDLLKTDLAGNVCTYLAEMCRGNGAVRAALHNICAL